MIFLYINVGEVPLRGLFDLNEHLLLSHPDFPAQHAYLACQTLTQYAQEIPNSAPVKATEMVIPVHPGAQMVAEGLPLPKPPAKVLDREHTH